VSPGSIGLLFAVVNAGSLASTLAAAGIGRRVGTVRAIVVVRALGGLLLVPMVLAPTFWIAGAVYFVRMFTQRIGLPLRQSFTQDVAHPDERASVAALSNLPAQGTMGVSQVLAGYLFESVGLAAPFELSAVLYGAFFGWAKPVIADGGAGRFASGGDSKAAPSRPAVSEQPPVSLQARPSDRARPPEDGLGSDQMRPPEDGLGSDQASAPSAGSG
jgi:MFS family permease